MQLLFFLHSNLPSFLYFFFLSPLAFCPSAFPLTVITLCAMLYALGEALNRNSQPATFPLLNSVVMTQSYFSHVAPSFHYSITPVLTTFPLPINDF
ncbi:MAG: hypothetical protein COZ69_12695 [Deltaproteobacteria bacterium CG_4_8_14_3_um_filter_45_9]|nr:MAG: hypothetical protein COZ69_12695 [Deltaproteobacteria bacterium CG_4_8_14_3_um_filter_45_9]